MRVFISLDAEIVRCTLFEHLLFFWVSSGTTNARKQRLDKRGIFKWLSLHGFVFLDGAFKLARRFILLRSIVWAARHCGRIFGPTDILKSTLHEFLKSGGILTIFLGLCTTNLLSFFLHYFISNALLTRVTDYSSQKLLLTERHWK